MGTVVFTSPLTLWVFGLQKQLFPFIFHGNVSLFRKYNFLIDWYPVCHISHVNLFFVLESDIYIID